MDTTNAKFLLSAKGKTIPLPLPLSFPSLSSRSRLTSVRIVSSDVRFHCDDFFSDILAVLKEKREQEDFFTFSHTITFDDRSFPNAALKISDYAIAWQTIASVESVISSSFSKLGNRSTDMPEFDNNS